MKDDSSMEFDMFEDVRRRLTRVFEGRGHDEIAAERAALYVVQGLRDGHRLIASITRETRSDDFLFDVLTDLFENATALEKARVLLNSADDKTVH